MGKVRVLKRDLEHNVNVLSARAHKMEGEIERLRTEAATARKVAGESAEGCPRKHIEITFEEVGRHETRNPSIIRVMNAVMTCTERGRPMFAVRATVFGNLKTDRMWVFPFEGVKISAEMEQQILELAQFGEWRKPSTSSRPAPPKKVKQSSGGMKWR